MDDKNVKYRPDHQQRLALINGSFDLPDEVVAAMKKIRYIFSELAQLFCAEAYNLNTNAEQLAELFNNAERSYNKVVYSLKKQDLRSVRTVVEYCKATKEQISLIPDGMPFNTEMVTTVLDACQMMKNIGCDATILPYGPVE